MMITWSLQKIIVLMYIYIHVSNACITVEHDDGSQSVCNQTMTIPCTNLQCALPKMRSGSKMVIGAGDSYTLSYDDAMTMYGMNSIVIEGEGSDNTVITCDRNAGLAFINMNDITIANLTLKECGALRNSTTHNGTKDYTLKFHCGLYFLNCSDVTMYNVIVTDGPGTGVMMYDTVGTVTIENSHFIRNRVPNDTVGSVPGGGGVYIEFTYCLPNTTDFGNCTPTQQGNAIYLINNCTFLDNTATTVEETTTKYIFPVGPSHQQFGRGGGLSIHFKGNTTGNIFTITNCTIKDNTAVWGGGILLDFLDSTQDSHVIIKEVNFISNSLSSEIGTGGGAIRINYFPQVDSPANIVNIMDCVFDFNTAYFGGAVSLYNRQENGTRVATNRIILNHCTWQKNFAHIGSAVDLSSSFDDPGGLFVTPVFKNCSFIGNINVNNRDVHGLGTLHSDEISFSLEGDNYFIDNNRTALIVVHAVIVFEENALAIFTDNHGYRGGAMALWGNTWLKMLPNTRVVFIRNSAEDKGGAIYYNSAGTEVRDLNSRKCFIRYYDHMLPPTEWNTSFKFINNTSHNPGHAIYCTTLVTCSWNDTSIIANPEVLNNTFHWNGIFTYSSNDNDTISTDPANIESIKTLGVAPGQLFRLNISISDDLGIPRKTVVFAHTNNNSAAKVANTSTYISDNQVKVLGSPGESFKLKFHSITTRVLSFAIDATFVKCPPGFYFPKRTASSSLGECTCSTFDKNERYKHISYCKRNVMQAVLQPQHWAGYIPWQNDSVLVTGKCPSGYCYSNGSNKLSLPTEADPEKLYELICLPNNRNGTLCGRCKAGYHIYANAKDYAYKCGKCSIKYGHVIQIFAKYVPLTMFLITIMLLDINLASGPLNTFVFFSQMLPSLDLYAGGEIPVDGAAKPFVEFYQFCYGLFNLEYFESLDSIPGWCTFEFDSALSAVMLEYLVAFWPLLIICIVWLIIFASDYCICGERSRRNAVCRLASKLRKLYKRIKPKGISLSESFFRGLVTFILLSYTKFTLISLNLLTPAYLYGPGGKKYDVVVNLDGTLKFFGHEHLLYYATPAIIVLVFIVLLPLFLFATYPYMCNCLGIPTHKMMHFFDALNSAFKKEYGFHYFSLLYFVYRIILVAIYTFAPEVQQRYMLQQVFIGIVLIAHVIAQPYKEKKHNIIDLCLLALIPTVISISSFQVVRVTNSEGVVQFSMAIQIILLYIPLIYLAVVIVYRLYLWKRHRGYTPINNTELSMLLEADQGDDRANHNHNNNH